MKKTFREFIKIHENASASAVSAGGMGSNTGFLGQPAKHNGLKSQKRTKKFIQDLLSKHSGK